MQKQPQEPKLAGVGGGMAGRMGQMPNQTQGNFFSAPNMQANPEQAQANTLGMMKQRPPMMPQQAGVPQVAGNVPAAGARTALTHQQLRERAQLLTTAIKELEKQSLLIQAGRNGRSDADYFNELQKIQAEIASRRQVLLKVAQTMHSLGMTGQQPQASGNV